MTLNCSDGDAGTIVSYQLQDDGDGTFAINPAGEITLTKGVIDCLMVILIYISVYIQNAFIVKY